MKKKSILLAVLLMTSIFNVSFAAPAPYVDYLYNDTNYPIIGGRQGVGRYLDLTSLDIIKNDQFGVEFEVNVLSVNHNVDDWENKQPIVWTFHYFKNYSEPNSMYYVGHREHAFASISWEREDLGNRVGTMEVTNNAFKTCMEHITGKPYRY